MYKVNDCLFETEEEARAYVYQIAEEEAYAVYPEFGVEDADVEDFCEQYAERASKEAKIEFEVR